MANIASLLMQILNGFATARAEPLTDHPLAKVITRDLAQEIEARVADPSYKVTGSAGRGNWALTPWVAVFDRLVTEGAQRGFYLVYLFKGDGTGLYLSLNQGTTEVYEAVGGDYLGVLEQRASTFAELLSTENADDLHRGPIELGGQGLLTKGYEAGSALAHFYGSANPPDDQTFNEDLLRFIVLYRVLVERRDALVDDVDGTHGGGSETETEARKGRWHFRAERSSKLVRDAKRIHGTSCAACGFSYPDRYGDRGEGYIEAHHLVPFASLKGRPTQLDPKSDFTVLCANCHRMVHRKLPPLELEELIGLIQKYS